MLEAYGNKSHFISYDITGQKKAELTKAGLKKKRQVKSKGEPGQNFEIGGWELYIC